MTLPGLLAQSPALVDFHSYCKVVKGRAAFDVVARFYFDDYANDTRHVLTARVSLTEKGAPRRNAIHYANVTVLRDYCANSHCWKTRAGESEREIDSREVRAVVSAALDFANANDSLGRAVTFKHSGSFFAPISR